MRNPLKVGLLWLVLIVTFIIAYRLIAGQQIGEQPLRYGELVQYVENGDIGELTVQGQEISGKFKAAKLEELNAKIKETQMTNGVDPKKIKLLKPNFLVIGPKEGLSERMMEKLEKLDQQDAEFSFSFKTEDDESFMQSLLISWLPMIVLLGFFFFFMRQVQGGGGKAMSFGKSRAKMLNESQKKVTFNDIAGADEAKEELKEIVDFLKEPKRFTKLGGRIPKGVLLMGSPGTGKTLIAKGVAGEAGVPFFSISGSDFVEMFVGVGASRVRDLFEQGKKNAPCIIFIDEIDAVGRQRGAGLGGGHDEREQTLNQLLVEMDGFEHNEGVIIIAATNRPDVLDSALLRPGRFDRRVVVNRPDVLGREQILKVHTRKVPIDSTCDLNAIAKGTPGFSGADLENLVNEAALMAAKKNQNVVKMIDFEEAKDKVMMGAERRSMIISEHEKKTTAYHEAGHALVAALLPGADPVHKVTIIPRGRALGVTQQLPSEDRLSMSKDYAGKRLAILMGGRIAEELIFNQITTGAGQDIEMATQLARNMVCQWGMSEKLGPLAFGKKDDQVFLGREIGQTRDYSEQTAQDIDAEVRRFVTEGYDLAKEILEKNITILEAIAQSLLERETLDAQDVLALVKGEYLTKTQTNPQQLQSNMTSLLNKEESKPQDLKSQDENHDVPELPSLI
jgi:cell division protease FtsH